MALYSVYFFILGHLLPPAGFHFALKSVSEAHAGHIVLTQNIEFIANWYDK